MSVCIFEDCEEYVRDCDHQYCEEHEAGTWQEHW